jgi:phage tail tape-measure protein
MPEAVEIRFEANVRQMEDALADLRRLHERTAESVEGSWRDSTRDMERNTRRGFQRMERDARGLGATLTRVFSPRALIGQVAAGAAIGAFSTTVIRSAANMEQMRVGLKAV